jgi:predicted O-methyltransferase YrrM
VPSHVFDAVFAAHADLGHSTATEVAFISRGRLPLHGATSDHESWLLAVLAKRSKTIFEFGTCTGRTAYLLARNSPPDARVHTLTLPPDATEAYQAGAGDTAEDRHYALAESIHERFCYQGTDVEPKVVQLYGDSKAFDETPYAGRCDLIFVDGAHAYSYVVSDSSKALRMVAPGGVVIWHDYRGPHRARGVYRALNELTDELPLVHIEGTCLVAYRRPQAS